MNIYADNAATTKMSAAAKKAYIETMDKFWANPSSLHTPGQIAKEALNQARADISELLGAEEREIYFTSGGSESDNQAIISAALLGEKKGKKHIVSSAFEHHGVLHTLNKLKKQGYEISLVDINKNGIIKAEDVKKAIRKDTALVTIMFANNEIGTIQPIAEIGEICKEAGVMFHTDAVQAAGHIEIDVKKLNVDMLSIAAHKFGGPKGVGALYARKGVLLSNLIEGGAQERGKRGGTENLPAIVSMAAALKESCGNMARHAEYVTKLRNRAIAGLSQIPNSLLNGDINSRLPGNINMCFEGIEGEALLLMLDFKGIYASSGSACTSGSLDPSHVLLALGLPHEVAHGSLRLSINHETTEEDIDYIIEAVKDVVKKLRDMSPVWEKIEKGLAPSYIKNN